MFSKHDLRSAWQHLARLLPPGAPLRTPEDVVEVQRLLDVLAEAIKLHAPARERGVKVLEWRLPRARAPRLNEFAYLKVWQKARLRKELDDELRELMTTDGDHGNAQDRAPLNGARRRRWARVTRFSTQRVDDLSVDVLGGKMPMDALVRCGVLVDDDDTWLEREAIWLPTARGNTHVLVEVFECVVDGLGKTSTEPPKDVPIKQVIREQGTFTRAITKETTQDASRGKKGTGAR